MSVTGGDGPECGRPDPYEDLLAEGFGQDAVSKPVPSGAKAILKTLVEDEAICRQRLGDKGYERALANWHAMWGDGTR